MVMSHLRVQIDGKVKDILSVLTASHPEGLLLQQSLGEECKGRTSTCLVAHDEVMQFF